MALKQRTKTAFTQRGVDTELYSEICDELAVDDVIAFMAQSEAQRTLILAPRGDNRDVQTPSDELKSYLMNFED